MSEGNLRADQLMVPLSGKVGTGDFNFLYSLVAELDDVRAKRIVDLVLKYNRHVPPVAASAGSEDLRRAAQIIDTMWPTLGTGNKRRREYRDLARRLALSGSEATELYEAAHNFVRCSQSSNLSPYISENGRNGDSPWVELVAAVEAARAATQGSRAPQED